MVEQVAKLLGPGPDGQPQEYVSEWHAYSSPLGRIWFWEPATGECFYADTPPPAWAVFRDPRRGYQRWRWNRERRAGCWEYFSFEHRRAHQDWKAEEDEGKGKR